MKLASIGPLRDHDWIALRLQWLYQPLDTKRFVRQQRPKLLVPDQFLAPFAGMPLARHQSGLEQIAGASHKARILALTPPE